MECRRNNPHKYIVFPLILVLVLSILIPNFNSYANDYEDSKIIKVGWYNADNFQEGINDAKPKSGYCYEYLQNISQYTGWNYKYEYGDWSELYQMLLDGELDMMAGISYSEDRQELMEFPEQVMGYYACYFYKNSDDDRFSSGDLSKLNGCTVATIKSNLIDEFLSDWLDNNNIQMNIVNYDDMDAINKAMTEGAVDTFVTSSTDVTSDLNYTAFTFIGQSGYYLAVGKGRTNLLDQLNYALSEIHSVNPYYTDSLQLKYFNNTSVNVILNDDELSWLDEHKTINVGYLNNCLPYSSQDENGEPVGLISDLAKELIDNLNISDYTKINFICYDSDKGMISALHNNEIDVVFPTYADLWVSENNSFFQTNSVIAVNPCLLYKNEIDENVTISIAVNRHSIMQYHYTLKSYPNGSILYYANRDECINAVDQGIADGTIVNSYIAANAIDEYSDLKILPLTENLEYTFGVSRHNLELLSILNKGISSLEPDFAYNNLYKYTVKPNDYSLIAFIKTHLSLVLFIILFIAYLILTLIMLSYKQKKNELEIEKGKRDELTGLYNRKVYEQEIDKFEKNLPSNLVFVSIDANGLKRINDNFGHLAGDELIIAVAKCMDESFGNLGKLFRSGGDEYSAMLLCDKDTFKNAFHAFEDALKNYKGNLVHDVSASTGFVIASEEPDISIHEIIKLADKRMYEDKNRYYKKYNIERRSSERSNKSPDKESSVNKLLASLNIQYECVYVINLETNTYMEISTTTHISDHITSEGNATEALNHMLNNMVAPEYRDTVKDFIDLSTIKKRLSGRNHISLQFYTRFWCEGSFIISERNPDGEITKVFWTVREIEDMKK